MLQTNKINKIAGLHVRQRHRRLTRRLVQSRGFCNEFIVLLIHYTFLLDAPITELTVEKCTVVTLF